MPFDRSHDCVSQTVRIPLRVIDAAYGSDGHDNAGDDMVHYLRTVTDSPNQYTADFTVDTGHANPWYHAMVMTVPNISQLHYDHRRGGQQRPPPPRPSNWLTL